MSPESLEVRPGPKPRHVLSLEGRLLEVPVDWALLPPGDAALSRRIKADGPSWTVIELLGRKRFSRGIWAPAARIESLRAELRTEREDPQYQRQLEAGRRRRASAQTAYAEDFRGAVLAYLGFHARYAAQAETLARLVSAHATPVGSGTVARTQRIPIEERAEAATLAWMRHHTTSYDSMQIARVKGRRREVRRLLVQHSLKLLAAYREGRDVDTVQCPLQAALSNNA